MKVEKIHTNVERISAKINSKLKFIPSRFLRYFLNLESLIKKLIFFPSVNNYWSKIGYDMRSTWFYLYQ